MNKRIRQLAVEAKQLALDAMIKIPDREQALKVYSETYDTKFAELIVLECIKSTLSLQDNAIDNQWKLDETFHVIVDTIVEDLGMQHIFRG